MEKKKMRTGVKVCLIISIVLTLVALAIAFVPSAEIYSSCIGIDTHGDSLTEAGQLFGTLMIYSILIFVGTALLAILLAVWGTYAMILFLKWLRKTNRLAFWIVLTVWVIMIAVICVIMVINVLDVQNSVNTVSALYPLMFK